MREDENTYQYNQNYYNVRNDNYNRWDSYKPVEEKKSKKKIVIPLLAALLIVSSFFIYKLMFNGSSKKDRTIMIYMVGSDLESKSKQGTFSISDIVDNDIDLKNNNIILMVGGAKKWHNFVSEDEIGIYKLTTEGFEKIKKLPVESMGSSDTLESFLDYSYKEYPADKYDMIFWNHGLGAIGIEQDELSKDFLTISELDNAFKNSNFIDEKLELTIFYNCLASNLHIANIMKNYSNYMVASEEVFYLSKALNRLKFLGDIKPSDSAYDIGYTFIKQSDKVVKAYNETHDKQIDSTLSIIDLSNVSELNEKLNNFIKTIDVNKNYYDISYLRRYSHTYGISQTYDYDTVDLYSLVESLGKYSSNKNLSKEVLNEIKDTVKYTSNLNDYSKGISIYFPYFGKESSIETHLSLFEKLFNDNYYSFINEFHQVRTGEKRLRRSRENYNKLTNEVMLEDGYITLELNETEKNNLQEANIYLFKKEEDKYNLLLAYDNIGYVGNKIMFSPTFNKLLSVNGNIVSYSTDIAYGKLADDNDELDVKFDVSIDMIGPDNIDGVKIKEAILDSKEYISSSIVEVSDYSKISFAKVKYSLFENDIFNEDFKDTKELEYIEVDKDNLNISYVNNQENDYYALIEVIGLDGYSYYTNLKLIN